ncbi:unnamed protein product [Allacma fusca]|uniref:Period circadian protein n=1 Tax=Allacma fusca TaxID=39272 RepID=A0A8J2JLD8_9HEXA|nr:unnamed protein product [Allacma fusca]
MYLKGTKKGFNISTNNTFPLFEALKRSLKKFAVDQHEQPTQGNQVPSGTPGKCEKRRKKKTKVKSTSSTDRAELSQRLNSLQEESKKNPPNFEKTSGTSQNAPFPGVESTPEPSPDNRFVPPADSKTLQMAALNHVLSCFKNVREQDLDMSDESDSENMSSSSVWSEQFEVMKDELKISQENCFGGVFGMADGLVVHMTDEITSILGYPKDMWMGRSFMDLVHPKDKVSFASQFTTAGGYILPAGNTIAGAKDGPQNSESFFCRLRQYRGLKTTGFGVTDKPVTFFPFKLTLKIKAVECIDKQKTREKSSPTPEGGAENTEKKTSMYIFIGAHRISSAYQYPEEVPLNPDKFVTRHSASCQLGHMDQSAVPYLGHLPQDVIGHSMLDYYHPDDMLLLREIYEGVMVERGKPFRSKPYRFRAYNGSFATLETDWSCFINPWSWKLEFVIGQHKVVKGPLNPNVFMPPKAPDPTRPEVNVDANVKRIQDQIKQRLTETVSRRTTDPLKVRLSRRKKDLTVLLETLLDQIGNYDSSDGQTSDSVGSAFSVMERDSVMLGEISPHHDDHSGSNQSSETPPSYNQLNYRENIERFFLSHPKTTRESDESGDAAKIEVDDLPLGSTEDEDSKGSPNDSSGSGAHRQSGNDSMGDNNDNHQAKGTQDDDKPCSLTEDILYRHNENMEKSLIKRHRETRGRNTSLASSHKNSRVRLYEPISGRNRTRDYPNRSLFKGNKHNSLKRPGNLAGWVSSESSRKAHKYPHFEAPSLNYTEPNASEPKLANPALWPPYSVGSADVAVTTTVTTFTPTMESRTGGMAIPRLAPVPTPTTRPMPEVQMQNILNQQQSRPFMCFPSQPQQYVSTPGVSYAMPGSANILYQPMGAPSMYGQQPNLYGPTPPILMGGPPLLGSLYNPTGQLMPTVPGAIRTLNVGGPMQLRPNVRIIQPGAFSQMQPNAIPYGRGNSFSAASRHVSITNQSSGTSGNLYPMSAQSISSGVTALSTNDKTMSAGASAYAMKKIPENINIRNPPVPRNDSSSSSSPELSNLNTLLPNRLLPMKASADFSSSDGFLDSSSGSMYSLLKSDDSGSPSGSGEGKDSFNSHRFQSHGSDDQDMLWESHLGKNDSLDLEESRRRAKLLKQPPWLQDVSMTRELSMGYQIADGDMSEILQRDLNRLQIIGNQSTLVDEQLEALYNELQADGKAISLNLEEGDSRFNSSFSSNEDEDGEDNSKREISRADYEKIVQVYEENAPFPIRNRCPRAEKRRIQPKE